jgi:hypothetical protein
MDRETTLRRQRESRKANGNQHTKRYEKTPKGFLMRLYRNMKSRITGVQKQKFHLYNGKTLLSKEDFMGWALTHPRFKELFEVWTQTGYERRLAPSVDRISSSEGYELVNMEWVTHSVNSSRGSVNRHKLLREYGK